ncbi:hypothetical protein RB653_005130 [Dictyostelium firmibasis]|uniref:Niemann-Pick C1 N-terminal domain-containing protein n=1 Tax=Dictyostelium firmibasis TaxID=79012 RepID=A0AAN7UKI7_9MYCE
MNINKKIYLFTYFLCVLINHVYSQGPFPYNTTKGCSIYSFNETFVKNSQFQPYNSVSITSDTCQASHPEYSVSACCTTYQTNDLKVFIQRNSTVFGRCQGCLDNIWSLYCGSVCSPYQQSFMVPTNTLPSLQVINIDFILHPDFAQGLYDSCSSVKTDSGKTFGQLYTDKKSFFSDVFGNDPMYQINFVFNTTGYNSRITPCSSSSTTSSPTTSSSTSGSEGDSSAKSKHSLQSIYLVFLALSTIFFIF